MHLNMDAHQHSRMGQQNNCCLTVDPTVNQSSFRRSTQAAYLKSLSIGMSGKLAIKHFNRLLALLKIW